MRRGLSGHVDLVCAVRPESGSYLRAQSFSAPLHLSKPHLDGGALVVNLVNPTGGLLAGDRVDCRVSVEPGARLLLTAPSASRAHRTPDGTIAVVQDFRVAAGGALEVWPELFIPQAGARYGQRTALHAAAESELLFFESLAPGRTAMGEAFAFTSLSWETELYFAGTLLVRERFDLTPESANVRALRRRFPTGYYASCLAISPKLLPSAPCWAGMHALHADDAWVGCSAWSCGGGIVKLVAADSMALRRTLGAIRETLYRGLGRPAPNCRRTG